MVLKQLSALRRKDVFYRSEAPAWVRNIWPRVESFNWFCKNHRDRLIADGAMVKLGRDFFVDVNTFPKVAQRLLGVTASGTGGDGKEK